MSQLGDDLAVLRRLRSIRSEVGPRCELCGEGIGDEHRHVVDVEARRLMCTCRACTLLFDHRGAGANARRAVPERYARVTPPIEPRWWDRLQLPVGVAFFVTGASGSTTAFYPGPAGATECELSLSDWEELCREHPGLADVEPDVEAVLVRLQSTRSRATAGEASDPAVSGEAGLVECLIVPVDVCYQLVGVMRQTWRGFDGGTEAQQAVDELFGEVGRRADHRRRAVVSRA